MIGRVKNWLGIEGLKVALDVPEVASLRGQLVKGKVQLHSRKKETVDKITIQLIERYRRGRKKDKLINEYVLATLVWEKPLEIPAGQVVEIPFRLEFERYNSPLDDFSDKNWIFKKMAGAVRLAENAHSDFRVEVTARAKSIALDPFVKQFIFLR